jgi:hypothetical protein
MERKSRIFTFWDDSQGKYSTKALRISTEGLGDTLEESQEDFQARFMNGVTREEELEPNESVLWGVRMTKGARECANKIAKLYGFNRAELFEYFIYRECQEVFK